MLPLALLTLALLCHARGLLPDPACTPGAVETTSIAVICGTSTRTRRHVDEATKRAVLASYGVDWADRASYEVDHLIPLEVGGANAVENLWPEPLDEARRKDRVEDAVHRAVCAGRMTVDEAQRGFAGDWTRMER